MRAAFLIVVAIALFGACGFQRQGVAPMSPVMRVTYLDAKDERTDFQLELRRSLAASGTRLADRAEDATATLRVSRDETGRRVLSVSSRNTPLEYEVYYTVTYSVSAGDKELMPSQTVTLTRDYSFSEEQLLAKEHEEDILRAAIARDLAGIVMRRLASL
jgi:LPS-assembly lipoprotein